MAFHEIQPNRLRPLDVTSFAAVGLKEREDLQRYFREQIELIDPDLLVISEEFSNWEASSRRVDLLAVDTDGNLVVIELKRTDDGGHMELQALRYAAMVSTMTFDQAAETLADHLRSRNIPDADAASVGMLAEHLGEDAIDKSQPASFNLTPRIILVSADFSQEITSTVLWLNERGLDIRCIKMQVFVDQDRHFMDIRQVLPLPEAQDYIVKLKRKAQVQAQDNSAERKRHKLRIAFWTGVIAACQGKTELHANLSPAKAGYIGTSAGFTGLMLTYVVRQHESRIELYIDRGPNRKTENLRIFEIVKLHSTEIESVFGAPLDYQSLPGKRAARVAASTHDAGYADDPETWPALHAELVTNMIRFNDALKPAIEALRKQLP